MLEKAIQIAAKAHEGQKDKAGQPYILHPLRVMLRTNSEIERICAVLHDVIEDTPITLQMLRDEGFTPEVLNVLELLTKRQDESYDDFISRILINETACRVKLADLYDNMNLSRIQTPTEEDYKRVDKYKRAVSRIQRYLGISGKTGQIEERTNEEHYAFLGDCLKQEQESSNNIDQRTEFLRISHVYGKTVDEAIKNSVKRAYRDLCRTLRGFGAFHNKTEIKNKAEELLCCELHAFLTNGTSDFCEWHRNLMQKLIKAFCNQPFTIGQAQKWINMSFKYLYCFTVYNMPDITKKQFEQCHTPIDNRVMYNAHKLYSVEQLPVKWSKLNDYDLYIDYQMKLKSIADSKGITQLELDFELWQP